mmetsp:Transcript_24256/g.41167  ORF Transcript_24256/g.41167 Transcript_24256/m.41167 type:complete len:92 (-) Transcript_24256:218-493(-)
MCCLLERSDDPSAPFFSQDLDLELGDINFINSLSNELLATRVDGVEGLLDKVEVTFSTLFGVCGTCACAWAGVGNIGDLFVVDPSVGSWAG